MTAAQTIDVEIAEPLEYLWKQLRFKVAFGGRASTKSWGYAQELVIAGHQRPLRILCAREIQKSIHSSVISLLSDTIRRCGLEKVYDVQRNAIYHPNGTEFLFAGLKHNIDNIKSMEGIDICWVEEARNVSEDSWSVLIPTIRKEGSEIWVSFNPYLDSDPTYQRFVTPYLADIVSKGFYQDQHIHVQRINYIDNPWFSAESRLEMEWTKSHDFDLYRHVWLGECVQRSEARVFNNWTVDDFDVPPDTTFYYGADWGFSRDPTVLLRCFVDDEERILYFDQEAYQVGVEIDALPDLFDQVPGARQWPISADNARPETISYLNNQGFNIKGVKKGKGSVDEGVEFLKSYQIVVHPRCKHIIDELSFYSYKTDRITGDILPVLVDANNHCIDSARYALERFAFKKKFNFHIG